MITLMKPETTLYYVRKQMSLSRFAHAPRDFCFLFKGHALDPSVEDLSLIHISEPTRPY